MTEVSVSRLCFKIPLLLLIVGAFVICTVVTNIFFRQRGIRLRQLIAINKFFGQLAFSLLRIDIECDGKVPDRPVLIVCNHMSYIDPLVLFTTFKAIFVTSVEVKENSYLGPLCRLGGCYFVERRNKFKIKREITEIGQYLQMGLNVAFFPEGTSTNGEQILRFKRSFFQVAVDQQVEVLPVCLRYLTIDGQRITANNRDRLYWYGTVGFFSHLVKLLSVKSVTASVEVLPTIVAPNKNSFANQAQLQIEARYYG